MIQITEHTRDVLLEVAKKKKIYIEGNFLKLLKAPKGDKDFEDYLKLCKEKDITARKKRLEVTKQVQQQNKQLEISAKKNDKLMSDLKVALEETERRKEEAEQAKAEAEKLRDSAISDLETLQKYIEETHAKMSRLHATLKEHNFTGYIEADGGVNLQNIGSVFADGARAFVGGGAIVGQQDVRAAIKDFRTEVLKSRRRGLLDKANELGGSDLVHKWIGLHIIGEKQDQIKKIAQEAGYL